jgi:hypothetical protein
MDYVRVVRVRDARAPVAAVNAISLLAHEARRR